MIFNIFTRQTEELGDSSESMQLSRDNPKESLSDKILTRANKLRKEMDLGSTTDVIDAGTVVLTNTAMEVLQTDGKLVHPKVMTIKDAAIGWSFVCYMAVPILSIIEDQEVEKDPNRFLMIVASAIFQFFDDESVVQIFQTGTELFQKTVSAGGDGKPFQEFTDHIRTLVLAHVLTGHADAIMALNNRYSAFIKLVSP